MHPAISLLGISGSLRRHSINAGLLRAASERLPDGVALTIFDLAPVPMYSGDLEASGIPAPVRRFAAAIDAADGVLIATPEYNGGLPALLKNAIDWVSRVDGGAPLRGKPLGIMGASPATGGTAGAQRQLRELAQATGMIALTEPEVRIGQAWRIFGPDGDLTDAATGAAIGALLAALTHAVRERHVLRAVEVDE